MTLSFSTYLNETPIDTSIQAKVSIEINQTSQQEYIILVKDCRYLKGENLDKYFYIVDPHTSYIEYTNSTGRVISYRNETNNRTLISYPKEKEFCLFTESQKPFNITQLNEFYAIYGLDLILNSDTTIDRITFNFIYPSVLTLDNENFDKSDKYISFFLVDGNEFKKSYMITTNTTTTYVIENLTLVSKGIPQKLSLSVYLVDKPSTKMLCLYSPTPSCKFTSL